MTDLLTDDEVIAIAVSSEPWLIVLPTIDISSPVSVTAAALRGARSLAVRRLVSIEADGKVAQFTGESAAHVGAILHSTRLVVAYIASVAAPHGLRGGVTVLASVSETDDAIIDLISGTGIHEINRVPASDATRAVLSFLRNGFDYGVHSDVGELLIDHALFVLNANGDDVRVARIDHGVCVTGTFTLDDQMQPKFVEDQEIVDWAEFVSQLFSPQTV